MPLVRYRQETCFVGFGTIYSYMAVNNNIRVVFWKTFQWAMVSCPFEICFTDFSRIYSYTARVHVQSGALKLGRKLFKVNNGDSRVISVALFWCKFFKFYLHFIACSSASIADLEKVNVSCFGSCKYQIIWF